MRRTGIHTPTVEDAAEISGIETLHPGGFALTRRTAEVAGLRPGLRILDVSSGRGTQAVFYAAEYGVDVTGVDISAEMVRRATERAAAAGVSERVRFEQGDSQDLPYADATFDVAINECAVGIPDDSQAVVRLVPRHGLKGVVKALQNENALFRAVRAEKLGYGLYWGRRPEGAVSR